MATTGHDRTAEPDRSPPTSADHGVVSAYPRAKRALDLVLGTLALLAAGPLLLAIRIAMLVGGDRGPFLYRAERVGEQGRLITILKIRTMVPGAGGAVLTSRDDERVTRVGRVLRRYKLDELPQLWNVLSGNMALVGPRPEDPAYVDLSDPLHRRVFTARPGISGLAQLAFRHEADLLDGPDAERKYRETILPAKLRLDAHYLDRRSVRLDLKIIGLTVASILPRPRKSSSI